MGTGRDQEPEAGGGSGLPAVRPDAHANAEVGCSAAVAAVLLGGWLASGYGWLAGLAGLVGPLALVRLLPGDRVATCPGCRQELRFDGWVEYVPCESCLVYYRIAGQGLDTLAADHAAAEPVFELTLGRLGLLGSDGPVALSLPDPSRCADCGGPAATQVAYTLASVVGGVTGVIEQVQRMAIELPLCAAHRDARRASQGGVKVARYGYWRDAVTRCGE